MKGFNLQYLASYYNHILGEKYFDIKAFYNNYVQGEKVKGTLQGTVYPIFAKGVNAYSSSLQITFEIPCDNNKLFNGCIDKIQNLCGESRFNIDATYETENGEVGGSVYSCYSQLQLESPLTSPQESNGILVIIVQLTGAIRVSDMENELLIGYDIKTELGENLDEMEEISEISVSSKNIKELDSDMADTEYTKTPIAYAQNAFYTIDAYDTGKKIDNIIVKHIEKADNGLPEKYLYIKRTFPDGKEIVHKCLLVSDCQYITSPSTYSHYIINLQTVD